MLMDFGKNLSSNMNVSDLHEIDNLMSNIHNNGNNNNRKIIQSIYFKNMNGIKALFYCQLFIWVFSGSEWYWICWNHYNFDSIISFSFYLLVHFPVLNKISLNFKICFPIFFNLKQVSLFIELRSNLVDFWFSLSR